MQLHPFVHCQLAPLECVVPNVATNFQTGQFLAISRASVNEIVAFQVILYHLEPCDTKTSWWSFQTLQRKHDQNLFSIYVVVHLCYMPEEGEIPGLDDWGEKWLTGPPLNFCIWNRLVPLDTEQPRQAPLIESIVFPCIVLRDCSTFHVWDINVLVLVD